MDISPENKKKVDDLLATLVKVISTPFTNASAISALQGILGLSQSQYRDAAASPIYGELDPAKSDTAMRYKVLSIAYGVSKTSNGGYDYGSQFIKSATTPPLTQKLYDSGSLVVMALYRNYLEQGLMDNAPSPGGDKIQFLSLFDDPHFCYAFATHVLDHDFITNQLIAAYKTNPNYAQAVAYLYERMRPTIRSIAKTNPTLLIGGHSATEISQTTAGDGWKPTAAKHPFFKDDASKLDEFYKTSLPIEWSNEPELQGPSFPAQGVSFTNEWLLNQGLRDLTQGATSTTREDHHWSPSGGGGQPGPESVTTYYGEDLVNWMNSEADHGYGDVFNHGTVYTTYKDTTPGFSCFAQGTLVQTSDGAKAIESLQEGARVLSMAPAQYAVVSNERVIWPTALKTHPAFKTGMYGFNNEEPFFTAGHVFFTKAGPKAIKPQIAMSENPDIRVHELSVGDVLLRLSSGPGSLKYEEVTIQAFTTKFATSDHVYGLHFQKGDKGGCTYHANGYLVASNYPDITLKRLKDNFAQLSAKEQRNFATTVSELPSSFKKVFGTGLVNSFEAAFGDSISPLVTQLESQKSLLKEKTSTRHLHPASLVRNFSLIHWNKLKSANKAIRTTAVDFDHHITAMNGEQSLPRLSVYQGAVLLDGQLVPQASIDARSIHWSRPLPGKANVWEHGAVKTSADGTLVHGAISYDSGTAKADGKPGKENLSADQIVRVFGVSHTNDYNVLATSKGPTGPGTFDKANQADTTPYPGPLTWSDFHQVETGLSITGNGLVQVSVTMPELDRNWNHPDDPLYSVTSALNTETWVLTINITVIAGMEQFLHDLLQPGSWKPTSASGNQSIPPPFFTITMLVNMNTNVVTGDYTELVPNSDPSIEWSAGPFHALYCPYSPKAHALKTQALKAIAASSREREEGGPLALTASFYKPHANIHTPPAPLTKLIAHSMSSVNDPPLSFLQTMSTPADVDLHKQSQSYMIAAAAYWRGDDEKKVFGDERGSVAAYLPNSLKDQLSSEGRTFLSDHFAKNLLLSGLSRSTSYQDKFNDDRKDKLEFFWTGKTGTCLSHLPQFNDVTVITAAKGFLDLADDGFSAYSASPQDYAAQLYSAVTDAGILNDLSMTIILGNQNLVNRYCAILNALDRGARRYDNQLWNMVRDTQFFQMASASPEFKEDWSGFAQDFMKALLAKLASNDPSISDDMRKEMNFDADQLKASLDAKDAADLAFKIFDSTTELGGNILAVMDALKRRPSRGVQASAPSFFSKLEENLAKKPNLKAALSFAKGFIMIGMQAYTLWQSITFLLDWKDLSDTQRAIGILTTVEAVLRAIYELNSVYKELRGLKSTSVDFRLACVRWSRASGKDPKFKDASGQEKPVIDSKQLQDVPRVGEDGNVDPKIPERSVSEQIAEKGAASDAQAAENISKEFSLTSAVVEGVMVAVNIATTVLLGMELKEEWDHVSDSIRALDTINLIVQAAQVVTGTVEVALMVAGAEFAAVPAVGVLVVAAGLILMLVEQFYPRPKPDPVQDYLNDHGYGFIDQLDARPVPQLKYSTTSSKSADGKQFYIDIEVSEPTGLHPEPMISQLLIKVYAGSSDTDAFLKPTVDTTNQSVTANDITWSITNGNTAFTLQGNDNPDPNDHSLIGRIVPATPPTKTIGKDANGQPLPPTYNPGSSVLGTTTLKLRVQGTLNPALKTMAGQVTEIVFNGPAGVAGTDVVHTFEVSQ